jgi:hypothetical protein
MPDSRKTKLTVWERPDLLTDPGSLDGLDGSQGSIIQKTSAPMDEWSPGLPRSQEVK